MLRITIIIFIGFSLIIQGCTRKHEDITPEIKSTVILGTWDWDVESDKHGSSDSADFYWEQVTDTERYLVPVNGAEAKIIPNVNFDAIDLAYIKKQTLSTNKLSGNNDEGVVVPGTVLVFKTSEGNLGKMHIEGYRALHDVSFKEAENVSERAREFLLSKPDREIYHLQIKWYLFR